MKQLVVFASLMLAVQAIWNAAKVAQHTTLSGCNLETSDDLYALQCLNTTNSIQQFTVFDSASVKQYASYSQVRAARAVEDAGAGISFVEVNQSPTSKSAIQKVVQTSSRVFTSSINVPDQTFRLTAQIDIRMPAEMTSLIFNSSLTITKGIRKLSYDFIRFNATDFLFVACANDDQSVTKQQTQCDTYDAMFTAGKINQLTPLYRNNLDKTCAQTVRISKNYLATACQSDGNYTVTLFSVVNQTLTEIFSTKAAVRDRIELYEYPETAVVFYQANFTWQGVVLNCVNTIEVVTPSKSNRLDRHRVLHTERRYFYESHVGELKALHSLNLHFLTFHGALKPSVSSLAKSAGTFDDFDFDQVTQRLFFTATNDQGQAVVFYEHYLAFLGYSNQTSKYILQSDQYIDFNQTYLTGGYVINSCSAISSIITRDWNAIQAMMRCTGKNLSLMPNTPFIFNLTAKSFELDGFGCKMDQYVQMTKTGPVCRQCGSNCATCEMAPNSCTSCLFGLEVQNGLCGCDTGQYFNATSKTCKNCSSNCLVCSDATVCQECDGTTTLNANRQCTKKKCAVGQYFDKTGEMWACRACLPDEFVSVDSCQKCDLLCSSCTGNNQCSKCGPNAILTNGKCQCVAGYYFDVFSSQCLQCSTGCKSCVNASTCDVCQAGYLKGTIKCHSCAPDQYINLQSDSCEPCGFSCSQCEQYAPTCSACGANSSLQGQACICDLGFWSDNVRCQSCMKDCEQCSNDTECQVCKAGFHLDNNSCKNCGQSQYVVGNECKDCQAGCLTCADKTACTSCTAGSVLFQGACVSCPAQQRLNQETGACEPCGFGCLSCTAESCQQCVATTTLDAGSCVCLAAHFKVEDQNKCQRCAQNCAKCSNASSCDACEQSYLLGEEGCVKCQSNEFFDGKRCVACSPGCMKCTNATSCDLCMTGMSLIDGGCVCPAKTYFDSDTCKACHATCASCTSASVDCIQCVTGFQKAASKCIVCSVGSFIKDDLCLPCGNNCSECTNGTGECIKCAETFLKSSDGLSCACADNSFISNAKCTPCNSTCATCKDQLTCLSCANSLLKPDEDGRCCLAGYFSDPTTQNCEPCKEPCKSCKESATSCTLCNEGSFLDKQTCQSCLAGCATCRDGQSCITCQADFTMGDTICLKCQAGYRITGDRCEPIQCGPGCVQCHDGPSTCTACQAGMQLNGQSCVCSQRNQFFDKSKSGCVECPQGCASCSDQQTCLSCVSLLHEVKDGTCVQKTCIGSTYLDITSGQCTSCPEGHQSCSFTEGKLVALACKQDFTLTAQTCLKCDKNQIIMDSKCVDCSSKCQACSGSPTTCTSCAIGLYFNNLGECQCPIGLYFNSLKDRCQLCPEGCQACVGESQCSLCSLGKVLLNGVCQNELICKPGYVADYLTLQCAKCPPNCQSCTIDGVCQACERSSVMTPSSKCVTCPDGQVLQGEVCKPSTTNEPAKPVQNIQVVQKGASKTTLLLAIVFSVVLVLVILGAILLIICLKRVIWRNQTVIGTQQKHDEEAVQNQIQEQIELPQLRSLKKMTPQFIRLREPENGLYEDSQLIEATQDLKKRRAFDSASKAENDSNYPMMAHIDSNRQAAETLSDQLPADISHFFQQRQRAQLMASGNVSESLRSAKSEDHFVNEQRIPDRLNFRNNNFLTLGNHEVESRHRHTSQPQFNTNSVTHGQESRFQTREIQTQLTKSKAARRDSMVDAIQQDQQSDRNNSEPRRHLRENEILDKCVKSGAKKKIRSKLLLDDNAAEDKFLEAMFTNILSNVKRKSDLKEKKRMNNLLGLLKTLPQKSKAMEIRTNEYTQEKLQGPPEAEETKEFLRTTNFANARRSVLHDDNATRFNSLTAYEIGEECVLKEGTQGRQSELTSIKEGNPFGSTAITTRDLAFKSTIDAQETEHKLDFANLVKRQQQN